MNFDAWRIGRGAPRAAAAAGIVAALAWATGAAAQENVEAGKRLYLRVSCIDCHGWAGDGGDGRVAGKPSGPNLRATKLDREDLMLMIRCGKPQELMPFYEKLSYTDERCRGQRAVDIPSAVPPLSNNWLTRPEIAQVADFLFAKVIGRGAPTFEECEDFWGKDTPRCAALPKAGR